METGGVTVKYKDKVYVYDYNRTEYNRRYYEKNKANILDKAHDRYRQKCVEKRQANYSKEDIAERLLRAGDKVRREQIHLSPKQTLVISMIAHTLKTMESEYL